MKRLFICLANSKKYGERCIAGVEVERKDEKSFKVVRLNDKPKWIRPVTNSNHGAVPETLVGNMKLLEVYEIEITEECPNGYQCENVKFKDRSFKKISTIGAENSNLKNLIENRRSTIFSNTGKAVPKSEIANIDHSLVFIKTRNAECYVKNENDKSQVRILFTYGYTQYDLPVTDTIFLSSFEKNRKLIPEGAEVYITISLGIEFNEWHYKLAAGIIII